MLLAPAIAAVLLWIMSTSTMAAVKPSLSLPPVQSGVVVVAALVAASVIGAVWGARAQGRIDPSEALRHDS